jgi:NAD(P)H-hydrate epimerase
VTPEQKYTPRGEVTSVATCLARIRSCFGYFANTMITMARSTDARTSCPHDALLFDRASIREVDRAAISDYGIPGVVLMENAARGLAKHAITMLAGAGRATSRRVLIVCGSGNNGGDGYAAARHLHNSGVAVTLATLGQPAPGTDAAINHDICRRMKLDTQPMTQAMRGDSARFALVIDAIFGTGLDREVTGDAAHAIRWINSSGVAVLAADVPSGMDCETGMPLGVCVKASATVTFAGRKTGFLEPRAQELLGDVVVADIGVPRELLERLGRRAAT